MRCVIQRVSEAKVSVGMRITGEIGHGILILAGFEEDDNAVDESWMVNKVLNMRIFPDDQGVMNRSVIDMDADLLVVSQFTLHASTKKGNRPSYIKAAKPEVAVAKYHSFVVGLAKASGKIIETGEFGAMMKVELTNDGPVTIIIDSKNKE